MTSNEKFGIEDSNFRFRFSAKIHPPGESEVLEDRECDREKIVKLTGFHPDEIMIKGWRVEPLHMPPVVRDIL